MLPNWLKPAILVLLVFGCLYLLQFVVAPLMGSPFVQRQKDNLTVMDFVANYEAGVLSTSADRFRIYDRQVQLDYYNRLIQPDHVDVPMYCVYPPHFFSMMAVFSLVPMKTAYIIWIILWPALFLWLLNVLLKNVGPQFCLVDRLIILVSVLLSQPGIFSLKLGQTSWCLGSGIILFFLFLVRNRDVSAGVALALTSFKIQYLLFLVLPALRLRRWKLLASAAVAQIVLLVIAGLNVGWQSIILYPSWLAFVETSKETASTISSQSMANLKALLGCFLPQTANHVLATAAFALSLLYLCRVWHSPLAKSDPRWPMALTIVAASTLGLHSHDHDMIVMAVAAALTLPTIGILSAARLSEWPLRYWSILFLYYPFISWLCLMGRLSQNIPFLALPNIALLGLGIVQVERMMAASCQVSKAVTQSDLPN